MSTAARRDVFQAIADPTRRQIIELVAREGMSVTSISERFDVSRPAISQHLKILTECGLIIVRQQGRERICEAKLETLTEVAAWVDQYRQFWNHQLDSLDAFLKQKKDKKKKKHKK